ncbi:methyltransferase, FxLD system [Nonomuraea deserti]|uniref:Protein-L-isoaspartate O-methyltransferase n=2 Tax=Nonomuraea deserti TaxID=1848322 RepID=A0A4R4VWA6_9ACTN|nr:methyltransferase, FxLD system [Nonomuraea deserti]
MEPMEFAALREGMVAALRERRHVGEPVAAALRAVPRHLFVPGVDPEDAYRDEPIVTKRDAEGRPISSSSQPAIMATMLDQLGVLPGHRVLEIGAGTGYNAALLARLTGPGGRVVSVDIDADIVAQARSHLAAAGTTEVEVVCADGAQGHPPLAPYDRVIATVGVWDLAPAWLEQLGPAGRLVVPLDLRGVQVSVAMERAEGCWESVSVVPCGFMRMRGPFAGTEALLTVRREPELTLTLPEPREVGDVAAALQAAPTEIDTGVIEHAPPFMAGLGVSLWLALHEPRWCALSGRLGAGYGATAGILGDGGIALLAVQEGPLVARGHGPGGAGLAADLAGHVRAWDAAGRPDAGALRVRAYQGPAPGGGAAVIEKRHTTLALSFP